MTDSKTKVRVIKADEKGQKKPARAKKPVKKAKRPAPKPKRGLGLVLVPFIAIGRYFKNSWIEIRQVRWPNRRATWGMTLSVIVYTLVFLLIIVVLDALFTLLFNKVLG
jgi:preprotein translocase SecE subunit